jgi:hypothetical protein
MAMAILTVFWRTGEPGRFPHRPLFRQDKGRFTEDLENSRLANARLVNGAI